MSLARMVSWINYRQGWRTLCWAALLVGVAGLLDGLPLFDVLGYDSAFALGLVAAMAGVDIGHGVVSGARRQARPATALHLATEAALTALASLALPLLLSFANALRVRNCNLGVGVAFFALLPACTAAIAAGYGAALTVVIPAPRLGRLAVFGLPLLSIGWALLRLYRDPAIFAFDPFGGYFPGPIYDEALRPPLRLLWFRLANVTWAVSAVATAHWLRPRLDQRLRLSLQPVPRSLLVLALLGGSAAWFAAEGALGIHVTNADLDQVLPRVTITPHFVLRTNANADSNDDLALTADDLEFRYQQLARTLGVTPSGTIRVYRFASASAKKDAVGAANTLFAKPWTREVFVQADGFPAQRLRHELAHVFAAAFGDPVFGLALRWRFLGPLPIPHLASGLVEGIAEAADFDNPAGRSTLHEEAAAMIALGQAPPLSRALGAGFTTQAGARAYTVVGSFCRYLLDTYGAEKLRALYRSAGNCAAVYGQDLPALEAAWRTFLATLPVDESTRAEAKESFRRPAIFHKVCARELSARVTEARARLGNAPAYAVALMSSVCADDPAEPTYRLDLAEAEIAADEPERALATLRAAEASGVLTRPLQERAASLEAAIHFHAGQTALAEDAVAREIAAATDDAAERLAKARERALRDPQSAATIGRVLFGDERGRTLDPALAVYLLTLFRRQHPDEALGAYLVGRQLVGRDPKLALGPLADACPFANPAPAPLDGAFLEECRRLQGEAAYRAGELTLGREAFAWLASHAERQADRLRSRDFLARITWKESTFALKP